VQVLHTAAFGLTVGLISGGGGGGGGSGSVESVIFVASAVAFWSYLSSALPAISKLV
jgi:hypothetical protein